MFTGIVERTGKILSLTRQDHENATVSSMQGITRLLLDAGEKYETALGDSVAINGCCLTVTSHQNHSLSFDVSGETLAKTALGDLKAGCEVNLERALRVGDRLGGHIVSGHIDGTGVIHELTVKTDGWDLVVSLNLDLGRYCIPKGSICLDGVSLTLNTVQDLPDRVLVGLCLIPTTVGITTFKHLKKGQRVNVEVDNIGKYVERLVKPFS